MKPLLSVALIVLVTLVGMVGFNRAGDAVSASQATGSATTGAVTELPATVNDGGLGKSKISYLTKHSFNGGDAITACDTGFHMASISEILDPGNLRYANRTTAYDSPAYDEGFYTGWVRTNTFPIVGIPDYSDFRMSSFDQQSGTTMSRRTVLDHPSTELHTSAAPSWWYTTQESVSQTESVWCVEDPE